jgi:hypothetical protein
MHACILKAKERKKERKITVASHERHGAAQSTKASYLIRGQHCLTADLRGSVSACRYLSHSTRALCSPLRLRARPPRLARLAARRRFPASCQHPSGDSLLMRPVHDHSRYSALTDRQVMHAPAHDITVRGDDLAIERIQQVHQRANAGHLCAMTPVRLGNPSHPQERRSNLLSYLVLHTLPHATSRCIGSPSRQKGRRCVLCFAGIDRGREQRGQARRCLVAAWQRPRLARKGSAQGLRLCRCRLCGASVSKTPTWSAEFVL